MTLNPSTSRWALTKALQDVSGLKRVMTCHLCKEILFAPRV